MNYILLVLFYKIYYKSNIFYAGWLSWIEHRFSKPRVTSSNLVGRAKKTLVLNPHFRCCIKDSINIYFYPCFVRPTFDFGIIYKERSLLISHYYFHTSWYEIHPFTLFGLFRKNIME